MADDGVLASRIADLRARTGLTQAQLAAEAQLDRSAIAKIEKSHRKVSALELSRIADVLGVHIGSFFSQELPALVAHRNMGEPGAPSPAIDRIVERIAEDVDFVAHHVTSFASSARTRLGAPGSNDEVEQAAVQVRSSWGLDRVEPVYDLQDRAAASGIMIFSISSGVDSADAASLPAGGLGVALVNGDLHAGRRRLAAAHEIGHLVTADEYKVDWRVDEARELDSWESRMDRFARALLLPAEGLRRCWTPERETGDGMRTAAVKVASTYRVDMSTLARRLQELRIISSSEGNDIRAARTTRADIVDFGLVVAPELDPTSLPVLYQRAVLGLYRSGTISGERAMDLLFDTFTETDLPEMPEISEGAVWALL